MIVSVLVTVFSAVFFGYWLRLVIRMVANARSVETYANQIAATVRLNFPKVQAELTSAPLLSLPAAYQDLDEDYEMLTGLLRAAQSAGKIDRKLAILGYRLASLRFQACTVVGRPQCSWCARGAIAEMSEMVQFLAGSLGAVYAVAGERVKVGT